MALEGGLIVPVIRSADEKNVLGLQRAIVDLAARARSRQLKPDEVQGGTFSITNFGSFGSLMGTPVINQPQVAILGVGTVDKTPVVIDDAIAIRSICHLSLSFDHRLIDGALADQFMTRLKQVARRAGRRKCCNSTWGRQSCLQPAFRPACPGHRRRVLLRLLYAVHCGIDRSVSAGGPARV